MCFFPINAEDFVNLRLLGVWHAGFADGDGLPVGERQPGGDQAVRAQEASDRFPLPRVAGCFELLSYLTQQMEDEHTDKNMPIHAVFKLVVIWAQSERALDEGKAVLRLEQRQVKRPELWGIERLVGLWCFW